MDTYEEITGGELLVRPVYNVSSDHVNIVPIRSVRGNLMVHIRRYPSISYVRRVMLGN